MWLTPITTTKLDAIPTWATIRTRAAKHEITAANKNNRQNSRLAILIRVNKNKKLTRAARIDAMYITNNNNNKPGLMYNPTSTKTTRRVKKIAVGLLFWIRGGWNWLRCVFRAMCHHEKEQQHGCWHNSLIKGRPKGLPFLFLANPPILRHMLRFLTFYRVLTLCRPSAKSWILKSAML